MRKQAVLLLVFIAGCSVPEFRERKYSTETADCSERTYRDGARDELCFMRRP
jgi:hypothetical protein